MKMCIFNLVNLTIKFMKMLNFLGVDFKNIEYSLTLNIPLWVMPVTYGESLVKVGVGDSFGYVLQIPFKN